jgi:hypothetical protein
MAALETILGQVTARTATGFKLDGGEWLTVSKFADPKPEIPPVGARVVVGLDQKGFAYTVERTDLRIVEPAASAVQDAKAAAQQSVAVHRGDAPTRDTIITRLAVLKSASHIAASRPTMDRAALLELATALEAWAVRS